MNDYSELSEQELQEVIDNAARVLKMKQEGKKKEVIEEIKKLAASVNLTVEIHDEKKSSRKGIKVPIKYRHPEDPTKVWTGRGVTPKWMQELINNGLSKEDCAV